MPRAADPKSPKVAVVIPCYNRETSVRAAVESVLAQGYPALEVIAVDDHSTDGTRAALEAIADPRLRVVANPGPRGVSAARNHGVRETDAAVIAFQDSDDLWRPGKLAAQMACLAADPARVAVYCGMVVTDDAAPPGAPVLRYPGPGIAPREGDILPSLVRGSFISTQTLLLRRAAFDAAGGFDEALPALVDWDLMLRVAPLGRVGFVDADLVEQRMSGNSITRARDKRLAAQERILVKHADLLAGFPAARAHHHYRLAGAWRRAGDMRRAGDHAAAARRLVPALSRTGLSRTGLRYGAMALWLQGRRAFGLS